MPQYRVTVRNAPTGQLSEVIVMANFPEQAAKEVSHLGTVLAVEHANKESEPEGTDNLLHASPDIKRYALHLALELLAMIWIAAGLFHAALPILQRHHFSKAEGFAVLMLLINHWFMSAIIIGCGALVLGFRALLRDVRVIHDTQSAILERLKDSGTK